MRKAISTVAVWLSAVTLSMLSAMPAHAYSTHIVLGEHQNFAGETPGYSRSTSSISFSDKASSVKNYTSSAWVLYDDRGYGDRHYCIRPGQVINDLHYRAWNFGDKISSLRRLGTRSCAGHPTF